MRHSCLVVLLLINGFCKAQPIDSLNTAKGCLYMTAEEREMIYEINRLRSDPRSYLEYIEPMLAASRQYVKKNGRGPRNYSLTYTFSTFNAQSHQMIDTICHYV